MLFFCLCALISAITAFLHVRIKRRDAARRYASAFAQWEAEWGSNGVHEHEDIHTINANIQMADQLSTSSRRLKSGLVDHSQKMIVAAKATTEKKAVEQHRSRSSRDPSH